MTLKRIILAFAVLAVLFVGLLFFQLFGPPPAITVSPQTTFIVEPLGDDGLPDFGKALLARSREGVTPENNGALPFWRAMGPGEMSEGDLLLVSREIGLETFGQPNFLERIESRSVRDRLQASIEEQLKAAGGANAEEINAVRSDAARTLALSLTDAVMDRPWTAEDAPLLATWIAENERPLDLLVEAGAKPRFYSPSPTLLQQDSTTLIAVLLPGVQEMRAAGRALAARCMFRLGNKDYLGAWKDCRAIWQLGDHASEEWTLVAKLVGIALRGVARSATLAILNEPDLSPELTERILADLTALDDRMDMADAMQLGERLAMIDIVIRTSLGQIEDIGGIYGAPEVDVVLDKVLIDADPILRRANKYYDRLYAAASLDDYDARAGALASFQAEVDALRFSVGPADALGAVISRRRRSEVIGDMLLALMLPAVSAASEASDRDEVAMTLARTAAALAVYRARHREYPESLTALTPDLLPAVPIDLFVGKPLIYERRGQGYLLYSVGINGTDEGGDDEWTSQIIDGEWVEQDDSEDVREERVSHREGDYVIRMPLRLPEMPELPNREPSDAGRLRDP